MNWNFLRKTYEENPYSALRVLSQLKTNIEDIINTTQLDLSSF